MLVEKTIDSANNFTNWKQFAGGTYVDFSIADLTDSTITIQKKYKRYETPNDAANYTSNEDDWFYVAATAYYRIGKKAGNHGSDSVKVKLSIG